MIECARFAAGNSWQPAAFEVTKPLISGAFLLSGLVEPGICRQGEAAKFGGIGNGAAWETYDQGVLHSADRGSVLVRANQRPDRRK
jgi:hypothetical protein